jgi:4'-phosphopantetheinyl transferase
VSPPLAPPGPEDVHVWQVRLDVEGDELQALAAALSADERERARRFVRPRDASRSAAARGHLRRLLGRYLDCPAAELALGTASHGKPYVSTPGAGWLRFSLSHSGERGLVAVANGREVGVDIERIQPELAGPGLARLFTLAEQRALTGVAGEDYVRMCFELWTRKEAVVKGLGIGLSVPLNGIEVLGERAKLSPDVAQILPRGLSLDWAVCSVGPMTSNSAACAVEGLDPPSLKIRHLMGPLS